ncbi:GGDEF domain-containing protein [Tumebacillus permanentifrigoris]|uniref:Diguanylate cyclase (GGDEF)-like protein n=1 Tax=Tumebacillus permanentifrigoris TaxID=378543 RepID=A0A316DS24_9BACL|nr:diguanylate cyclase [Tumebacillus permanentifrigoris]PWK07948.1 diguanylate cyclase (GGDEF)-like protein [Tumebacillus permanentifrigoris]
MSKSERIKKLVEAGRSKYIVELDRQITTLEGTLASLGQSYDSGRAQDIYRSAHRLKGSAPTFGLNRVGEIAEHLTELWEWSNQSPESGADRALTSILSETHTHLIRLKIEYEIARNQADLTVRESLWERESIAKPGRLLLIDDDSLLRSYLAEQFQVYGYEVDEAEDVAEAKRKLYDQPYDLLLLDLMMYPQSGYEMFKFLKEDPTMRWLPLIVLSGREDLKDKVRCLRSGADDYVTKPFQFEELEARVYNVISRARQFESMAFRDGLTGVFNRRYFDHQLLLELEWSIRDDEAISLAFIDIDNFKAINDSYGHQSGDMVLQGLAKILQSNLRPTDLLARYGGEEFVVLMPRTEGDQAKLVIERVLSVVRSETVASTTENQFRITFSSGIAEWRLGMSHAEMLRRADEAMYQAKLEGRNRVICHS